MDVLGIAFICLQVTSQYASEYNGFALKLSQITKVQDQSRSVGDKEKVIQIRDHISFVTDAVLNRYDQWPRTYGMVDFKQDWAFAAKGLSLKDHTADILYYAENGAKGSQEVYHPAQVRKDKETELAKRELFLPWGAVLSNEASLQLRIRHELHKTFLCICFGIFKLLQLGTCEYVNNHSILHLWGEQHQHRTLKKAVLRNRQD